MSNPISVVINRPRAPSVRLRYKGAAVMLASGTVSQKFVDEDGRIFWLEITEAMLKQLQGVYDHARRIPQVDDEIQTG
jgi:hypothetical protein